MSTSLDEAGLDEEMVCDAGHLTWGYRSRPLRLCIPYEGAVIVNNLRRDLPRWTSTAPSVEV